MKRTKMKEKMRTMAMKRTTKTMMAWKTMTKKRKVRKRVKKTRKKRSKRSRPLPPTAAAADAPPAPILRKAGAEVEPAVQEGVAAERHAVDEPDGPPLAVAAGAEVEREDDRMQGGLQQRYLGGIFRH